MTTISLSWKVCLSIWPQIYKDCSLTICDSIDDPYYYLYYGTAARVPSYFALETEHDTRRVLRFDSMSKILSSGMRIGFVTGPNILVNAINQSVSIIKFSSLWSCICSSLENRLQAPIFKHRHSHKLSHSIC